MTQVAAHYAEARSDSFSEYAKTAAVVRRLTAFSRLLSCLRLTTARRAEFGANQRTGIFVG